MSSSWFTYDLKSGKITDQAPKQTPFAEPIVSFSGDSISGTVTAGQTVNIDYPLTSAKFPAGAYLDGGFLISSGAAYGDHFSAQVVDVDNILGYGAGFVVNTYIIQWYIDPARRMEVKTNYAALIIPGLYLRIVYTSTGTQNVWVGVNYQLHAPNT